MLSEIARILQHASGLKVSDGMLERAVRFRMKQCGIDDLFAYRERVGDQEELAAIIELVVVHETWFFRDPDAFAAVADFAQKKLASSHGPLRILSLPCSSGEEPYSIAISLVEAGVSPSQVMIEAMDISSEILELARHGLYGPNAFRSMDLAFRNRHFIQVGQLHELHQDIRRMVTFSAGNLLELDRKAMSGTYDVIFCRNLLIYFEEATQIDAIQKLRQLLDDDGLLFVGYAEVPIFFMHGFVAAAYKKAFALSKNSPAAAVELMSSLPAIQSTLPRTTKHAKPELLAVPPRMKTIVAEQSAPEQSAPEPGWIEKATLLADQGDVNAATAILDTNIKDAPDSSDAYFLLGLISEKNGADKVAEEHFRRAIYLNPDHYDALCHLALLAEQAGNNAVAGALKERAARVFRRKTPSPREGRQ